MTKCHFQHNGADEDGNGLNLEIHQVTLLSIHDTHFDSNSGGHVALKLYRDTDILITSCIFKNGNSLGPIIGFGGAISITAKSIEQLNWLLFNKNIVFNVVNTLFQQNIAANGGAISIQNESETGLQIQIIDCVFTKNVATRNGGAILIYIRNRIKKWLLHNTIITNATISDNSAVAGAGIYIDIGDDINSYSMIHMIIHSTPFKGGPIVVYNRGTAAAYVLITSSQFHENLAANPLASVQMDNETGIINNVKEKHSKNELIVKNVEFVGNNGSSIALSGTDLSLAGKVIFTGNLAYAGAAIRLDCSDSGDPSELTLQPNTTVLIINNTALHYGGGIAANPVCYHGKQCFYDAPCWNQLSSCTVHMEGKSALRAGNAIYGTLGNYCEPQLPNLFNISEGSEIVLLEPYTICFCTKDCITGQIHYKLELSREVIPGQEITVQASVCTRPLTDIRAYAIRATISTQHETGHLGTRQSIQQVTEPCDTLTYSVMTNESMFVTVKLSHDTITSTRPTLLKLTIIPCPQGFQMDSNSLKCDCTDYLLSVVSDIKCNVTTNLINVPAGVWIGNYTDAKLAAHLNCPLDYCRAESFIDLQQQDLQCSNNRTGVLCGACKAGLSMTLGTARCVDYCSNYYLFLLIPLALAGVLLVLLLLKCNLTVSGGTTNALIFYANIIRINHTIVFPQNSNNLFTKFLAVFIAWLNLDLGIDICLSKGITAYANTWMQFAFPVYIWMLIVIVIYMSRYSVTVSKLIGRNAVPVLATLFQLSYTKLLRTVIEAVSSITIRDESGTTHLQWLMDGNVSFLTGKHAVLFCMALLSVLLYVLPLTLLTLLAPLLQARSRYPLLRWVVRIKPLLDAYQGPYKDKYRHWTGVMLAMRLLLFTVFAANTLGDPKVNLLTIALYTLLYQTYITSIYKNRLNSMLDLFYNVNLSVYASATHFMKAMQRNTDHLTWMMVGSTFAVFCFILTWHLYINFPVTHNALCKLITILKRYCKRQNDNSAGRECDNPETPSPARQPAPTTSVLDMKELREPLLTDH